MHITYFVNMQFKYSRSEYKCIMIISSLWFHRELNGE